MPILVLPITAGKACTHRARQGSGASVMLRLRGTREHAGSTYRHTAGERERPTPPNTACFQVCVVENPRARHCGHRSETQECSADPVYGEYNSLYINQGVRSFEVGFVNTSSHLRVELSKTSDHELSP